VFISIKIWVFWANKTGGAYYNSLIVVLNSVIVVLDSVMAVLNSPVVVPNSLFNQQ